MRWPFWAVATGRKPHAATRRGSAMLLLAVAATLLAPLTAHAAKPPLAPLRPFFEQHCVDCHGPDKQKGEIRLDTLGYDLSRPEVLEIWQAVRDQLHLGDMPPAKAPQPPAAAVAAVVEPLDNALRQAYAEARSTGGETVLRRLNRHELRNVYRDLLHLRGADFRPDSAGSRLVDNNGNGSVQHTGTDPLRFFPEDEEEGGLFVLGDTLVMSDFLLQLTLDAAEEAIDLATHPGPRPAFATQRFTDVVTQRRNGEHPIEAAARERFPAFDTLAIGYERYGRIMPTELRGGVAHAGPYRIDVEVSAHHPDSPWPEIVTVETNDPFQVVLNIADARNGGIAGPSSTEIDQWSVPADGQAHRFTAETWLDAGWTPWVGWENGPPARSLPVQKILETHFPGAWTARPDKKTDKEAHERWPLTMAEHLLHNDGYAGPHLRLHTVTLTPLPEPWPPRSHVSLYGTTSGKGGEAEIRRLLHAFARRAFRRPVEPEVIEPYAQLALRRLAEFGGQPLGGWRALSFLAYEGKWDRLPKFDDLTPFRRGAANTVDLRLARRNEHFGLVFEGVLHAPAAGEYSFEAASDDGVRVSVDGKVVIEHDGLHGAALRKGSAALTAGTHRVRVEYFAYGAPNSLRLGWRGPGADAPVPLSDPPLRAPGQPAGRPGLPPFQRAMRDAYAAILCSPQFLYLEKRAGRLDDHDIATRLSIFLWSSMPDETLFRLAEAGHLSDPAERRRQVARMLDDPKAAAFVRHFTSAWLRLDKLGKMPPSGGEYQFYRNLRVEPLLLRQATTTFGEALAANTPVEQLIDSDTEYMNHTLAKWIYRREDVRGDRLRRVRLDDPRRGGFFTLPGVMTATANGVDTSPVLRGAWLLENVLGAPPDPPPDVEPLPTDTRGATTFRERFALHRQHEACNSCHAKIDPMGWAFENFDVVGRWRDRYPKARDPIDTHATLPNGQTLRDIVDLKQYLKERHELVTRCLVQKLLSYAAGRRLEPADRGEIDRIVAELAKQGNGLRTLIHLVVESDVFLVK